MLQKMYGARSYKIRRNYSIEARLKGAWQSVGYMDTPYSIIIF